MSTANTPVPPPDWKRTFGPWLMRLFVHATLRCPDHGEPVAKAVEEARKKIVAPPAKSEPAPVPLNWEV